MKIAKLIIALKYCIERSNNGKNQLIDLFDF